MSRRLALRAVCLLAVAGCGDDEGKPAGVGTRTPDGGGDASVEAGVDSSVEPLRDALVVDPSDAGSMRDSATPPPPPSRPDAAPMQTCADVDCSTLTDECNVGVCVEDTLECIAMPRADGTECGSQARTLCTAPDFCMAGVCLGNHQPAGRPCGDQDVECRNDDACDGNGNCTDNGLWAVGTACGDSTDNGVCDRPDSCDATGHCSARHAARGTGCGDQDVPCHGDDECNGSGACTDGGYWPAGTLCGGDGEPPLREPCHPALYMCDVAGQCVGQDAPDGTACGNGDDTECDNPDSCMAGFCLRNYEPRGVACGSSSDTDCDNPDFCTGFGNCSSAHEPVGTVCGTQSNPCVLPDACDAAGLCQPAGNVMNGMLCGSTVDNACDDPDTCTNGVCYANHASAGSPCGDQGVDCHVNDTCNGSGSCTDNGLMPATSACGDQGVACHFDDQCDASGNCMDGGLWSEGAACGDPTDRGLCDDPDSCDASGSCQPNLADAGTVCGDQGVFCLEPDTCDGGGACRDNGTQSPCFETISGTVTAGDTGQPLGGVMLRTLATSQTDSTTTASDGSFTLTAPMNANVLLAADPVAGYWGEVRSFYFDADARVADIVLTADSDMASLAGSVSGLPALDTADGVFAFGFAGNLAGGGETATLDVSSASPFVDSGSNYVLSATMLGGSEMWFINVDTTAGMTTPTVSGVVSVNECLVRGVGADLPVLMHTITRVAAACD